MGLELELGKRRQKWIDLRLRPYVQYQYRLAQCCVQGFLRPGIEISIETTETLSFCKFSCILALKMVTFQVMKYWHKLSAVSGLNPKTLLVIQAFISIGTPNTTLTLCITKCGPHMLIPGTQADSASSYTLPPIYTLVHTQTCLFYHDNNLYILHCDLNRCWIPK